LLNEVSPISLTGGKQKGLELLQGDFLEQSKNIPDNSIDLIFTDPPYGEGSIPLHRELAMLAGRVLKVGGSLVTFVRQFSLPEVFHNMLVDTGMRYWWMFAVKHNGSHQLIYSRDVFVEWKPLVWFVRGEKLREGLVTKKIGDLIDSKPPDKSLHELAQSPVEAEYIIENLTVENQTVLDPFMGAGNFGKAALKLKRQFIGIEIDPERFELAKANILRMN
jgi:DNA modification methylase